MRHLLCSMFLFLASLPSTEAASCRAGVAAQAGSQSGYKRAIDAADAWAQRQNNVSLSLGDCLGTISTTITAPTFPNLADLMNQIGQRICRAARDKIQDYVPPTIDPWGDLPATVQLSPVNHYPPVPQTTPANSADSDSSASFISLN